jgi:hypothetical protein
MMDRKQDDLDALIESTMARISRSFDRPMEI